MLIKNILFLLGVAATCDALAQTCTNSGIGTVVPLSKLEIRGCSTDSATSVLNATDKDSASILYIRNNKRIGVNTTNPRTSLQVQTSGNGGLYLNNTTGNPQIGYFLNSISSSTFMMGVDASDSKFKIGTTALGTNTRMTIDGSGNLGIGTASPLSRLNPYLSISQSTVGYPLVVESMPPGSSASGDGTGIAFYIGNNGSNRTEQARFTFKTNYYGVRPSFSIDMTDYNSPYTTFYSRFFIDPSGNVGIGTTNADGYKLRLSDGDIALDNNKAIFMKDASANWINTLWIDNTSLTNINASYNGGGGAIRFRVGGNDYMRINYGGNVGIGTTAPGTPLEVSLSDAGVGNITEIARFTRSGASQSTTARSIGFSFKDGSNNTLIAGIAGVRLNSQTTFDGALAFYVNNTGGASSTSTFSGMTEVMRIMNNGYTGIGTSSPVTKLEVNQGNTTTLSNIQTTLSANAAAFSSTYGSGSVYWPGLIWYSTDNNATKPKAGIWTYADGSGSKLMLGTSNSYATGITNTALVIDPSGRVGVGTTAPNLALDINGGIAARAVTNAEIGSNQNNYAIGGGTTFRLSSSANYNITGLSGGVDGKIIIIRNVGTNSLTFPHNNTGSSSGNRFYMSTGADIIISANHSIVFQYDSTSGYWYDISVR